MGTRNISISDEAYQRLKSLRLPGESFTDAINRMTRNRGILELAGVLSEHQASELTDAVNALRSKSSRRMEETTRRLTDA